MTQTTTVRVSLGLTRVLQVLQTEAVKAQKFEGMDFARNEMRMDVYRGRRREALRSKTKQMVRATLIANV